MVMEFIKMHGTGNDYVYIDCFKQKVVDPVALAKKISHRHFGVGSDGLILISPYKNGDGEMIMYNGDGSLSQMCGNGLRCVAKYIHDYYAKGKETLRIKTGAGDLEAIIHRDKKGLAFEVTVNMGNPIFAGLKIPTTLDKSLIINESLEVAGQKFSFSSVSMGNPHCVIFVENIQNFPVESLGPLIENHPLFPERVNVEFVEWVSRTELIQRTWERGSGETWACGTGAAAVTVVSYLLKKTDKDITIHLTGGDLKLSYQEGEAVFMRGNAVEVFRGEFFE